MYSLSAFELDGKEPRGDEPKLASVENGENEWRDEREGEDSLRGDES